MLSQKSESTERFGQSLMEVRPNRFETSRTTLGLPSSTARSASKHRRVHVPSAWFTETWHHRAWRIEGGIRGFTAALLAAHGYTTFTLGYFALDGLPQELKEIPLEYFKRAIDWFRSQPDVIPDLLGVVGSSRGGELALLLGSKFRKSGRLFPMSAAASSLVLSHVRLEPNSFQRGHGEANQSNRFPLDR